MQDEIRRPNVRNPSCKVRRHMMRASLGRASGVQRACLPRCQIRGSWKGRRFDGSRGFRRRRRDRPGGRIGLFVECCRILDSGDPMSSRGEEGEPRSVGRPESFCGGRSSRRRPPDLVLHHKIEDATPLFGTWACVGRSRSRAASRGDASDPGYVMCITFASDRRMRIAPAARRTLSRGGPPVVPHPACIAGSKRIASSSASSHDRSRGERRLRVPGQRESRPVVSR